MSPPQSSVVLLTLSLCAFVSQAEVKCCYGSKDSACGGSCDGSDDYCGASASQCTDCGGTLCNGTEALSKSAKSKSKSKEESANKCCYGRSPSDCSGSCDPADDYCGASESQCTECGGFFCNASSSPKKEKQKSNGVNCCYGKGNSTCSGSCDGPDDYCGKSESNCADCGGTACPLAGTSSSSEKVKAEADKSSSSRSSSSSKSSSSSSSSSSSKDETRLTANTVEKDGSTASAEAPTKTSSGWGWTALTENGVPTIDRILNTRRVLLAFSAFAGLALIVSFVVKKLPRRSTDEAHYIMIA